MILLLPMALMTNVTEARGVSQVAAVSLLGGARESRVGQLVPAVKGLHIIWEGITFEVATSKRGR